jgi:hypothetical protein
MTQQPYPGGPQGPQGPPQYYGPPPKKKTHKFRNFIVFPFLAFIVLIVVIVAASSGGGGTGSTPNAGGGTSKVTTGPAPADRGQPRAVTLGKPFTLGKHRFDAGWKMTYEQYAGSKLSGSVTNVSKDTSTAFFHVKFLKGNSVLANFQCSTNDLEPGQVEQVECFNTVTTTQRVTGYDKVTAEATF